MKHVIIFVLLTSIFCSNVHGTEQYTVGQHKEQLAAAATDKGVYTQYDRWPKDYFLIPQNLPFLVGLSLYHPGGKVLDLSEEQKNAIHAIRNRTVPAVLKMAGPIKEKELELAEKLIARKMDPEKLYALVDEIAVMRAELSKAHMVCIKDVQNILDSKQYAVLLGLAKIVTRQQNNKQRVSK